jgi:hypothetical protein
MSAHPETERAMGSPRLDSIRRGKRREPAYIEVWFGAARQPGYSSCQRRVAREVVAAARCQGFVGYLSGHAYKRLDAHPVPRRKVRVFLREVPKRAFLTYTLRKTNVVALRTRFRQGLCENLWAMLGLTLRGEQEPGR